MKIYSLILSFAAILFFGIGCKDAEKERLKAVNDSLMNVAKDRDMTVNDFVKSFNEIQANLEAIKQKEKIVTAKTNSESVKTDPSAKDKINEDILAIYELIVKNKKELAALQSKMKKSDVKISEFEKLVKNLNHQLEQKNQEIDQLKNSLAKLNIDVANLNGKIKDLNANIDTLSQENRSKTETIVSQDTELNTAFYVIGTKKELAAKKVITSEGGVLGIGKTQKLGENLAAENFIKIDIRETTTFVLGGKKTKLLTTHPSGSYELKGNNKKMDSLTIKNPKDFWQASKYLVIMVD